MSKTWLTVDPESDALRTIVHTILAMGVVTAATLAVLGIALAVLAVIRAITGG